MTEEDGESRSSSSCSSSASSFSFHQKFVEEANFPESGTRVRRPAGRGAARGRGECRVAVEEGPAFKIRRSGTSSSAVLRNYELQTLSNESPSGTFLE